MQVSDDSPRTAAELNLFASEQAGLALGGRESKTPELVVPLPVGYRLTAAGPFPVFDYIHLNLNSDGSVTWFSDSPNSETKIL